MNFYIKYIYMTKVNYVIVGGGTAGCVIASKLKKKGYNIAIIELGNNKPSEFVLNPKNIFKGAASNAYSECIRSNVNKKLYDNIDYIYGTDIGGSSNIDSMLIVRPNESFLKQLLKYTPQFELSDLYDILNKIETYYPLVNETSTSSKSTKSNSTCVKSECSMSSSTYNTTSLCTDTTSLCTDMTQCEKCTQSSTTQCEKYKQSSTTQCEKCTHSSTTQCEKCTHSSTAQCEKCTHSSTAQCEKCTHSSTAQCEKCTHSSTTQCEKCTHSSTTHQDPIPNQNRGIIGPILVDQIGPICNELTKKITKSVSETYCIPIVDDYNNGINNCVSQYSQKSVHECKRSSAYEFIKGLNIPIYANSQGLKLVIKNNNITGIICINLKTQKEFLIEVDKEVILCAGNYANCKILFNSGIGPKEVLDTLNIEQIVNIPKLGSFKNHYGSQLIIKINDDQLLTDFNNTGPVAFYSISKKSEIRDIQFITLPYGNLASNLVNELNPSKKLITFASYLLDPASTNNIKLSPNGSLIIDSNEYNDDLDKSTLISTMKAMYTVFKKLRDDERLPISLYYPNEKYFKSIEKYEKYEKYEKCVNDTKTNTYNNEMLYKQILSNPYLTQHSWGSCSIGKVVDSNFRVKDVQGLRIGDLSVLPISATGNTSYFAYLIGYMVTKLIPNNNIKN
jgi:choline dehydrogenase-like flavoprotein